ncbi:MAG TPA: hypothetical protein PK208_13170 [Fibrobacteria bacterium]|nr:hypothetical protein [Fibrobacteria bacterium]
MSLSRIVVIQPYFGTLPTTFPRWLASCASNSSIDWVIATDADVSGLVQYKNVKIVKMTFREMQVRAQSCFDFPINLERPYKLCDYRAFYDRIWREFVEGYDFWGYCDCDMIFGDIRKFARESILTRVDKFLGHGHFSIIRKDAPSLNAVLEAAKAKGLYGYREMLQTPLLHAFEEYDHYGVSYCYQKMFPDLYDSGYCQRWRIFDDIDPAFDHFTDPVKDSRFGNRGVVYKYQDGKLSRFFQENSRIQEEETLYIHLMKRRMQDFAGSDSNYLVVPDAFVPTTTIDAAFLEKHGKRVWDRRRLDALLVHWRAKLGMISRTAKVKKAATSNR